MKQTLINPQHVTHIKIKPATKTEYIWCNEKPEKKHWLGFIKEYGYEEGFWENGFQGFFSTRIDTNEHKFLVEIEGVLWSLPSIEIFAHGKKIYTNHYESVSEIEQICKSEFPNVSVILR